MKVHVSYIILLLALSFSAFSQKGRVDAELLPKTFPHKQVEYTFDKPSDPDSWTKISSGLHTAFGSTDQLYFRCEVPMNNEVQEKQAIAWKGERVNFQLLVWSRDTVNQVRFVLSDLKNEKGNTIAASKASFNLIRYILSNYPYAAKDAVCGNTPYKDGFLMPDRFETFDRFDLPSSTLRPVWLSINVPSDASAGTYKGTISVISESGTKSLSLSIRVQNKKLAAPKDWKYRLDLWQNPWTVAWVNHVEPWSEEHMALLKKHLLLYAEAGGKYITTYAVHSPWSDNSYMIEGGMIEWIKQKNNNWRFDYTIFDEYVELAMKYGINKAITIYTPLPGNERFRYISEDTKNYVYERWTPESDAFKQNWNAFLTDLKKHLTAKGWLKITYIGINENEMNQTLQAIKVIKSHSPDWRITYAGDWHQELDTLLDDYSFLYSKEPTMEQLKKRAASNRSSTYYVCCNPPVPNTFVFSPPAEARWISWYAAAFGYDGFLRWAYDAWPADPDRDARHGTWPAGDCFMIYPGANSSIRYEKLREGIIDFEKIRILKEECARSKDAAVRTLWKSMEEHLTNFTAEKEFREEKTTADINKGRELIEAITDKLYH